MIFLFGKKTLKIIYKPAKIIETKPTDKNDILNYNFKKNLDKKFFYSKFEYRICTNSLSLRIDCSKKTKIIKKILTLYLLEIVSRWLLDWITTILMWVFLRIV